jgi:hypothetical protein
MPRPPSILDRFYDPASPLDVARAVRALATESAGEVRRSDTVFGPHARPAPGGLLCERIFGPVESGRCACGALGGPRGRAPASPGERCVKCGVEAGPSRWREQRWGHVVASGPLLHPAVVPAVAALLATSADTVRAVARGAAWLDDAGQVTSEEAPGAATGVAALRDRLAARPALEGIAPAELIIDRIPVPPPGDRPLCVMPGGHAMPGVDTAVLARVIDASVRLGRLTELGAPEIILRLERRQLQQAFETLLRRPRAAEDAWSLDAPADDDGGDAWAEADGEDAPPSAGPSLEAAYVAPLDPGRPLAAALLTDGSVLLQLAYVALHLARDGRIRDAFPTGELRLQCTSPDGRFALFDGMQLCARDLLARAWTAALPPDLPCVVMQEVNEAAILVDARAGRSRRLTELGDYPTVSVMSPDGRHLWIEDKEGSGGVFSAASSLLELAVPRLGLGDQTVPLLDASGRLLDPVESGRDADEDDAGGAGRAARALVLRPNDRFRLAYGPFVADDARVILTLAGPAPVVAFHHGGEELLAVRRDAAVLLDLSGRPRVALTFDLTSIHEALRLPGLARRGGGAAADPLLVRFGGAWALAKATAAELRALPGLSAARLRRLTTMLPTLRPPRRVRVTISDPARRLIR